MRVLRYLIVIFALVIPHALVFAQSTTAPALDTYNYIVGTQTVGPTYGFTDQPRLIETAHAILDMGSNAIKLSMAAERRGERPGAVRSLTELASADASRKAILDMPFAYYFFWAHTANNPNWHDGLSAEESDREYREMYNFTAWLLTTYNRS